MGCVIVSFHEEAMRQRLHMTAAAAPMLAPKILLLPGTLETVCAFWESTSELTLRMRVLLWPTTAFRHCAWPTTNHVLFALLDLPPEDGEKS